VVVVAQPRRTLKPPALLSTGIWMFRWLFEIWMARRTSSSLGTLSPVTLMCNGGLYCVKLSKE
jgi:hypothetical protein